jgi:uncharacterized membrane protein
MRSRADIKARAKAAFADQRQTVIYATLLFVVFGILQTVLTSTSTYTTIWRNSFGESFEVTRFIRPAVSFPLSMISLFVITPLTVGLASFCIRVFKGETGSVDEMYGGAFARYGRNLGTMLLMVLYIILWAILLIIPGIIKALSYSMTPYILAENGRIGANDAIRLSARITNGRKMDIFVFGLNFLGWQILTGITLGILGFYTVPYINLSMAGLYLELKQEALARGVVTEADFA